MPAGKRGLCARTYGRRVGFGIVSHCRRSYFHHFQKEKARVAWACSKDPSGRCNGDCSHVSVWPFTKWSEGENVDGRSLIESAQAETGLSVREIFMEAMFYSRNLRNEALREGAVGHSDIYEIMGTVPDYVREWVDLRLRLAKAKTQLRAIAQRRRISIRNLEESLKNEV